MEHLDYSKKLNTFSYNCNSINLDFADDETKKRILLGRLYYSIFHYYLEEYPQLAQSSGAGKHETLLQIIRKERSNQEYILFSQLKSIREWGDYHPLNKEPFSINTKRLFHLVNKFINR